MKVVLTLWENRISPVADSSGTLLVVEIKNRAILKKDLVNFEGDSVFRRAERLSDLGVKIFICGAISDFFASLLSGYGIWLIPFTCGEANRVLDAYLQNCLPCPAFSMRGYEHSLK